MLNRKPIIHFNPSSKFAKTFPSGVMKNPITLRIKYRIPKTPKEAVQKTKFKAKSGHSFKNVAWGYCFVIFSTFTLIGSIVGVGATFVGVTVIVTVGVGVTNSWFGNQTMGNIKITANDKNTAKHS